MITKAVIVSTDSAYDRITAFFGLTARWVAATPAERRRFDNLWRETCRPQHDLTLVERATVIRTCRDQRQALQIELDRLQREALQGSKTADAAARTLDAELSILKAAIRALWLQSGKDPPPEDL